MVEGLEEEKRLEMEPSEEAQSVMNEEPQAIGIEVTKPLDKLKVTQLLCSLLLAME